MTSPLELIGWQSQEMRELLISAHMDGSELAEATIRWFQPWWTQAGLPIDGHTGFPLCGQDLLVHAGAVTLIARWETSGFAEMVGPHILSSDAALRQLVDRVASGDPKRWFNGEGASIFAEVNGFERQVKVPVCQCDLDLGASIVFVADEPTEEGIDLLAELLLEFSDLLDNESEEK